VIHADIFNWVRISEVKAKVAGNCMADDFMSRFATMKHGVVCGAAQDKPSFSPQIWERRRDCF